MVLGAGPDARPRQQPITEARSRRAADQQLAVVYQCPDCEQRFLNERRCPDCQLFCRRLGPGGDCPHCDEPVAINDLVPVLGRLEVKQLDR